MPFRAAPPIPSDLVARGGITAEFVSRLEVHLGRLDALDVNSVPARSGPDLGSRGDRGTKASADRYTPSLRT